MTQHPLIKLGLIGAGTWGRNYIAATSAVDGIDLSDIASRSIGSDTLPTGTRLHSDWHALIKQDLAGVIVATPPASHVKIAAAVIERGLAVLVEKPLAMSTKDVHDLIGQARSHRSIVHVGYIDLANPALAAILKRLPPPCRIIELEGTWANWGPFRDNVPALWDWGAHPLAVVLRVMRNAPDHVEFQCEHRQYGHLYSVRLYWGQTEARLSWGNGAPDKQRRLRIRTDEHEFLYDDVVGNKAWIDGTAVSYRDRAPLAAQVKRFRDAIIAGGPDASDLELSLPVTTILEDIERASARVGNEVPT